MTTVAVLYIDPRGPYPTLAKSIVPCTWSDNYRAHDTAVGPCACGAWHQLDCWDASRDARLYDGPHPVVAHPPCKHWGRLRHLANVRCDYCQLSFPERRLRPDGSCRHCGRSGWISSDKNCAPRAVEQVRRWGGVLEHPAGSKLWGACGLSDVAWSPGFPDWLDTADRPLEDELGGYTIEVDQVEWGHVARKRTWLYLVGVPREALEAPPFPGREPTHRCGSTTIGREDGSRYRPPSNLKSASAEQRRRTPPLFAEYLIRLARSVQCKI